MFTCIVENTRGATLCLTQNESSYQLISITGLSPPNAQINTTKVAGMDGTRFNSASLNQRNIVFTIRLNGDIEANRLALYSFFRGKERCRIYYKNRSRNVYIEGYVETVDCDIFTNNETMQVSVLCPNPYLKGIEEIITDISNIQGLFAFPFAIGLPGVEVSVLDTARITNILNQSESGTGVIIAIDISEAVRTIQLNNVTTGEIFALEYAFTAGDRVLIDTNKGSKSVTLQRGAVVSNLFTAVKKGSTFFQLDAGDNLFGYTVDGGNSDSAVWITFRHYPLYGGV